jgi:hypothetical protein
VKGSFAAVAILAASTAFAPEGIQLPQPGGPLGIRIPQPGNLFGERPISPAPAPPSPEQGDCPTGQIEVWANRHDQGTITFIGGNVVWDRDGASKRYLTGSVGVGVLIRIAVEAEATSPAPPLSYFFARSTWSLGNDRTEDTQVLIWNDHVFYPECRLEPGFASADTWCPAPGSAFAYRLELDDTGFTTRAGPSEKRCQWGNLDKTAASCDGQPVRVFMERDGGSLSFDHVDPRFGVSAGPQPFVRCGPG